MDYADSEAIFEEIRQVTPSYAGITYQRIEMEGLHWPCLNEEHPGTPVLHGVQFTRGKGMFHAIDWQPPAEVPDQEYPLYLTTGRILYHYHTGTMTMRSEDLMERAPESFVEISPQDATAFGVVDGGPCQHRLPPGGRSRPGSKSPPKRLPERSLSPSITPRGRPTS